MDFLIDLPNFGNEHVLRVTAWSESGLDLETKPTNCSPKKPFLNMRLGGSVLGAVASPKKDEGCYPGNKWKITPNPYPVISERGL